MSAVRALLDLASPGGARGRLSVLLFHRVWPGPDPLYPEAMDVARFSAICRWVASSFNVLPLDSAVRELRQGTLPSRALAITFDDGYADNRHVALPVLRNLDLPATVFVTTGFLDGGCMWNDIVIESFRRTRCGVADLRGLMPQFPGSCFILDTISDRRGALEAVINAVKYLPSEQRLRVVREVAERLRVAQPDDLMMTSRDVQHWRRAGMQVGAHSVSHPILAQLSIEQLRDEMKSSKLFLERLLGERVSLFAYPNGKPGEDYDARAVVMARELGFDAAMTSARGAATRQTDLFQIPRFTPWDRTHLRFDMRMATTLWKSRRRMPMLVAAGG